MNPNIYLRISLSIVLLCMPLVMKEARAADEWFGMDKFAHFTGSAITSGIITGVTNCNRAISIGVTLSFGVAKELSDKRFSWKDVVADVAGASLGSYLVRCK